MDDGGFFNGGLAVLGTLNPLINLFIQKNWSYDANDFSVMETAGLVAPVDFSVPEEGTKVVISQRRPRLVVMAPNTAVYSVYFRGHVFNLIRKYELDKGPSHTCPKGLLKI